MIGAPGLTEGDGLTPLQRARHGVHISHKPQAKLTHHSGIDTTGNVGFRRLTESVNAPANRQQIGS